MSTGKKSKIGFILEVYLEYPEKLHASTMIFWLQKNLQCLMKCSQIIVKKLQTSIE